jgi:hypothetical protein
MLTLLSFIKDTTQYYAISDTVKKSFFHSSEGDMRSSGNDKVPCWELRDCQRTIHEKCPAYLQRDVVRPCWDIDNTLCDLLLDTPKTCDLCIVYQLYYP